MQTHSTQIRQFYYSFNCKYLGEGIISVSQMKKDRDAENLNYLSKVSPYYVVLSKKFSRQEHWSGLPFPSPGDLPHPGINPGLYGTAGGFFTV